MMQEQQSSASGALLGELIKVIRQEAAPGGSAMTFAAEKTFTLKGIGIPDTSLAREITQFVRDTESALLFHHSSRVYYWGALAGKRRGLKFDRELLYRERCFTTWASLPPTAAPTSASRSTARTPLATSLAVTALARTTSIRSGRQIGR